MLSTSAFSCKETTVLTSSEAEVIHLKTKDDLLLLSENIEGNFVLDADIDCENESLYGAEKFGGTIDGNGHAIRNVVFQSKGNVGYGLISTIKGNVKISRLGLEGASLSANSLGSYVGGGLLVGVQTEGSLEIDQCYVSGNVSGTRSSTDLYLGGLIGVSTRNFSVTDCYSDVNISCVGIEDLYHAFGEIDMGGIIGLSVGGLVKNCYTKGTMLETASATNASYSLNMGGLVGVETSLTIRDCVAGQRKISSSSYLKTNRKIGGISGERLGSNYTLNAFYSSYNSNKQYGIEEEELDNLITEIPMITSSIGTGAPVPKYQLFTKAFLCNEQPYFDASGEENHSYLRFDEEVWDISETVDGIIRYPRLTEFEKETIDG